VPLAVGDKLGPYEILAPLGAGGMGEVYRAKDTKLRREVAIKVLPREFQSDPARLARFEREAQVLASLNHPHIAAIYGLEESQSIRFLVLELVEGPTLAERIARGALPPEDVLAIAAQIIEALEYAHERNVIHRDLKPANIKLAPDRSVKVLDFGLAKAVTDPAPASDPSNSPTLTIGGTVAGVILGTAAYMSPEQAQGRPLDKRTDIWSFGVVLYEMLTGKKLFLGETVTETLASVLKESPDFESMPARFRPLLRRCLEKDRKRRLRDIGDAQLLLESTPAVPQAARPWPWVLIAALSLALAAIAGIGWWRATRPVAHPLIRISTELAPAPDGSYQIDDTILAPAEPGTFLALSPDGTRLAVQAYDPTSSGTFRSNRAGDRKVVLASRRLDESRFTPIHGTENPTSPFFSPDGQWIAFFGDGKLRKIPVQGGAPVVLCSAENFPSGSWGDDGDIIAALRAQGGLSRISSVGGTPAAVTELAEGETMHRWPQVLPGSDVILFTVYTGGGPEDANIDALSLKTHQRKTLVHGGEMGRYVAAQNGEGYLVYLSPEHTACCGLRSPQTGHSGNRAADPR
jgi:serine/threonine protein kinase